MNLIFLGPPGVGKGTQAQLLEKEFGLIQISTGDILRKAIAEDSELGLRVKSFMKNGELVSDELVIEIVEERIKRTDCINGFILDGFPRNIEQAKKLDDILMTIDEKDNYVLSFELQKEELIKRLLDRSLKEGRIDDNQETIKNRLRVFEENTQPLIDYYLKKNRIKIVDAQGTIEEINMRVKTIIGVLNESKSIN